MERWIRDLANEYQLDLDQKKLTDKQQNILEAAIHLFAEKGYNGTTTSEIAKVAGVAEATIFKHYRTKKGLLLQLVIPVISKFASPFILNTLVKILEQEKPIEEILQDLIKDRSKLIETNWKLIRIVLVESLFQPIIRQGLQEHVLKHVVDTVCQKIDHLKKVGKIRSDLPSRVLLRGIISPLFGYLLAKNVVTDVLSAGNEEEELKWTVELMLNGINKLK